MQYLPGPGHCQPKISLGVVRCTMPLSTKQILEILGYESAEEAESSIMFLLFAFCCLDIAMKEITATVFVVAVCWKLQ